MRLYLKFENGVPVDASFEYKKGYEQSVWLSSQVKEKIFRSVEHDYRYTDAESVLKYRMDYPFAYLPKYINEKESNDLIEEIIDRFEHDYSMNVDESSTWEEVVYIVLAGKCIPNSACLHLDDNRRINMRFTYDDIGEGCTEAVYYDIFDQNNNEIDGGQIEYDSETQMKIHNIFDVFNMLFDFIDFHGDYEIYSINTAKEKGMA